MEPTRLFGELCHKRLPHVPYCYGMKDERLGILEIERAELAGVRAEERLRKECETKKILEALQKEKDEEFVRRMRLQQLGKQEHELQDLSFFINSAKVAQELVRQLKREDEVIEQRLAEAEKEALALREEFRAWEEQQKLQQEQKRLQGSNCAEVLRAQIEIKKTKTMEAQREKLIDREEMRTKIAEYLKQERFEYEASVLAKQKWRREVLENIREKKEFLLQQKINDGKDGRFLLASFEMEKTFAERAQQQKDKRNRNLERQQAISARLGAENLKVQWAKEQLLADIVNWHVEERLRQGDLAHKAAKQKAQQQQRMLLYEYNQHLAKKEERKLRELEMNLEAALKRKPLLSAEQNDPAQKRVSEAERYLYNKFLLEQNQCDREKHEARDRANQQLLLSMAKYESEHQNEIESAKYKILSEAPVEMLRYLPTSALRSGFIPEPINQKVRQQIRNDPIPMLTIRRHQPHSRGHLDEKPKLVNCCINCPRSYKISNIF